MLERSAVYCRKDLGELDRQSFNCKVAQNSVARLRLFVMHVLRLCEANICNGCCCVLLMKRNNRRRVEIGLELESRLSYGACNEMLK